VAAVAETRQIERPGSLQPRGGRGIAAGRAVDEMDMVAAQWRRRKAGHDRGSLPVQAETGDAGTLRREQPPLQPIRQRGRAIQRHAQAIVIFAEVRIGDDVA